MYDIRKGYALITSVPIFHVNFSLFRDLNIDIFSNDISFSKGEVFYEWIKDKIGEKYYGKAYNKETSPKVTFKDLNVDFVNCFSFINSPFLPKSIFLHYCVFSLSAQII